MIRKINHIAKQIARLPEDIVRRPLAIAEASFPKTCSFIELGGDMPKKSTKPKVDRTTREMMKMRQTLLRLHKKKGVLGKIAKEATHGANAGSGLEPPGYLPEPHY